MGNAQGDQVLSEHLLHRRIWIRIRIHCLASASAGIMEADEDRFAFGLGAGNRRVPIIFPHRTFSG
jgi:hypothetical protein